MVEEVRRNKPRASSPGTRGVSTVRVVQDGRMYYVETKWLFFFWERQRDGHEDKDAAIQAAERVYTGIQTRRNARSGPSTVWAR